MLLAVLELRANWGGWQWWPWWLVDFVSALLLVTGGLRTLRAPRSGRALLAAGWAFTLGMAWMSLAANIESGPDPARDARLGETYIALIGLLVASAFVGLVATLLARPPQSRL